MKAKLYWIIEFYPNEPEYDDNSWKKSSCSPYRGGMSLDEAVEAIPKRSDFSGFSYRIRNTKTNEIIPQEIFG